MCFSQFEWGYGFQGRIPQRRGALLALHEGVRAISRIYLCEVDLDLLGKVVPEGFSTMFPVNYFPFLYSVLWK